MKFPKYLKYVLKCQNGTLGFPKCKNKIPKGKNCTLGELVVLKLILENSSIKLYELAQCVGKSERTIKNVIASLRDKGVIRRVDGKRYGKWEVLVEIN